MTPPHSQGPAHPSLDLWNQSNDLLYLHDLTGRLIAVNATAVQTFGYSEAELLTMNIRDLVDPSNLEIAQGNLQAKVTGQTDRTGPYELMARTKDGRRIWVEVSTRILLDDGKPNAVYGSARVITVRKQAELMSDLIHDVSLSLSAASSLDSGVAAAMERLGLAAGWTYAESWFASPPAGALHLGPQWIGRPGLEKFGRLAKQMQFGTDDSLLENVYRSGQPFWSNELPPEDVCPRRAAAQAAGLQSIAVVPVLHEGKTVVLLVFMGPQQGRMELRWLDAAKKIAAQLGATMDRRLDAERVRSAARMFAAQFETMNHALLLIDDEGLPRHANKAFLALCGVTVRNEDAAIPLLERVDDAKRFEEIIRRLYEDRSEGRALVRMGDRVLQREVRPLRSRSGKDLGILLHLDDGAATTPR